MAKITINYCINLVDGVEPVKRSDSYSSIKLNIIIKDKKKIIE